jgi:hyaluronate lyase
VDLTRRRLLSLLPAAGALTAFGSLPARAGTTDSGRLMANLVDMVAGTAETNARPELAAKLASIDQTAKTWLAAMDGAGAAELFKGVPLGTSDANLNASYQHLYEIALATRTPGLSWDPAVRQRVIDGLVWLHEHYYGNQATGYYGNWFNWEIGISTHATRTLVLLAGQVDPGLVTTYVGSMDAYLRNGKGGDVDLDSRFHTGANLADITTNRVLQGALLADDARITKALSDQATVFATVDPYDLQHGVTDGYYADGSFIQHHSVAYTGSYGRALLTRVVQTVKILDGSGYGDMSALVPVVQGWVANGFAPLIFEGWMMEIVKGRAVSRTTTGYADVAIVAEAVVDLSGYAADPAALKSYVKYLRESSRAPLDPSRFVSPVSVARYAEIVADSTIPAADLNPAARTVAFNAMDKTVHRRPGYAFALGRSSDRISKYEYMSGENLMPWFLGDGAYWLYLSGQDQSQAFGVDFLATVSPYQLPGVTAPVEQRRTVPELYGTAWYDNPAAGFTSSSESQNTYVYFPRGTNQYSGGATLGTYGAAGLVQSDDFAYASRADLPADFVTYRNARSTKSWFLLDDEIVVLAAGVHDPAGRAATTAVDARIAAAADQLTLQGVRRDGRAWSGTGTADLRWLRFANGSQGTALGYQFLAGPPVTVELETVTRSRRVVRTANPDTPVTKQVLGVGYRHAAGARPVSLAYALVPNATEQQLGSCAVTVLANSTKLQAVRHAGLGLTLVNTFTAGLHQVAGLFVDGPASVIVRRHRGRNTVAVSDPTMRRSRITVYLNGRRLEFDTHQRYGATIERELA